MSVIEPKVRKADLSVVQRLTAIEPDGNVLTVYMNLDPEQFATPSARETQINSIVSQANERLQDLDADGQKALRQDIDIVKQYLDSDDDWAKQAKSLAIFCSADSDLFEVLKVPTALETEVKVDPRPDLVPLSRVLSQQTWLVALVNRRNARLFIGNEHSLEEVHDVSDNVSGQHDQGGWSQSKFERAIEEEVDAHLENVAAELTQMHEAGLFDKLIVGTTEELWPRIQQSLHSYVERDLISRIDVDVENIGVQDLLTQVEQVITVQDNEYERELLADLRQNLGRQEKAAGGIEEVLAALNEAKVATLLMEESFSKTGVWCATCGWLGLSGSECPVDGKPLSESELADRCLERCIATSAEIRWVRYQPDLQPQGGIAAILRF